MAFDPFSIGLTVLGGIFGSRSSSKAAKANEAAQREALELQKWMFEQTRKDYAPWLQAGVPALNEMMRMTGIGGIAPIAQTANPTAPGTGGTGAPDTANPNTGASNAGGVFAGGSNVPGGPTLNRQMQGGSGNPLSPTIGEYLMGSRPSAHQSAVRDFQNIRPQAMTVNSPLGGNLFSGPNNAQDAVLRQMAPAVAHGGLVSVDGAQPSRTDINTNLGTIMGNRPRAVRSGAGFRAGVMDPSSINAIDGPYMSPIMQAAVQRHAEQAAITPRATGGPVQPGGMYTMAEFEPEMLTTPQGSTMVTQPTLMQATQQGYVTPGPIGQSLAQSAAPQTTGLPSWVQGQNSISAPIYGGGMMNLDITGLQGAAANTGGSTNPQAPQPVYSSQTAQSPPPPVNVTTTPQLQNNPYSFMSDDPSYGFRFQEGQRALERSAAARGGLLSGGTGRRLARYGQDYASTEYMNRFNRLSTIAGMGQTMTANMGQIGFGYGGNMGNIIGGIGASRASGYLGQGSALGGSLQNLAFLRALQGGGG